MKRVINKICDVITIAFPAAIATAGVLYATGVADFLIRAEGIAVTVVGILSTIASIVFNKTMNKEKE